MATPHLSVVHPAWTSVAHAAFGGWVDCTMGGGTATRNAPSAVSAVPGGNAVAGVPELGGGVVVPGGAVVPTGAGVVVVGEADVEARVASDLGSPPPHAASATNASEANATTTAVVRGARTVAKSDSLATMGVWTAVCEFIASFTRRAITAPGAAPAHPADFPDPHVLRTGARYFAYGTQTGSTNVQVMTSTDFEHWRHLGDALPELPAWAAAGRTWSPSVLALGDRFVLYYAVREPQSNRQAISAAVGGDPAGPFVDGSSGPLIFQLERGGSIDPSPFVDDDGTAYLLWKSEDNALDRRSSLFGQRLSADGLSLVGEPVELLGHDRGWEKPLIEAPSAVRSGDTYFLFYSANWWESPDYTVGYATAKSPLGPYRKATRRRPWLVSGATAAGPGGQEFFTDASGALWMAYHAWAPGRVGYRGGGARSLRIAPVGFEGGRPVLRPR